MINGPISDLAYSMAQESRSNSVRLALQQAGTELSTGTKADLIDATSGDLAQVFSIDQTLEKLDIHYIGLTRAQSQATAMQLHLGTIQDAATTTGVELFAAVQRDDLVSAASHALTARASLDTVVSGLNGQFGGRFLFSGAADDTRPLDATQDILDDVAALIAAAPDAATAMTDIDAYFDTGGDFETVIYNGASEDGAPVATPDGDRIDFRIRADDTVFRDIVKGLSMAAAFSPEMLGGDQGEMVALYDAAADFINEGKEAVVDMRANLGVDEETITRALAYTAAQTDTFQLARSDLAGADPFEAAARFADLENQLTSVYTVTSRLSNLTLTNYLR